MALPGLLIEYLVNGAIALFWALPLIGFAFGPGEIAAAAPAVVGVSSKVGGAIFGAVILVPLCYVLGMLVDLAAYLATSRLPTKRLSPRSLIKRYVEGQCPEGLLVGNPFSRDTDAMHGARGRSARGQAYLALNAPGLLEEVKSRGSRDRVARGFFANLLLATALEAAHQAGLIDVGLAIDVPIAGLIMATLIAFAMWGFLKRESYSYELNVGAVVLSDQAAADQISE